MKGHAKIKVEIKNGVLFVYHNDGTLLHKRNATSQTWGGIWDAIESDGITMKAQSHLFKNRIKRFFYLDIERADKLTFQAVKIMAVFIPLFVLFQLIFNS